MYSIRLYYRNRTGYCDDYAEFATIDEAIALANTVFAACEASGIDADYVVVYASVLDGYYSETFSEDAWFEKDFLKIFANGTVETLNSTATYTNPGYGDRETPIDEAEAGLTPESWGLESI